MDVSRFCSRGGAKILLVGMADLGSKGIQLELGKLNVSFCRALPIVRVVYTTAPYKAIQKLLVPSTGNFPALTLIHQRIFIH